MCTKLWFENMRGRDHSKDLGIHGRIIMGWILRKLGGKVWTGFFCLKIGIS